MIGLTGRATLLTSGIVSSATHMKARAAAFIASTGYIILRTSQGNDVVTSIVAQVGCEILLTNRTIILTSNTIIHCGAR